MAVRVWSPVKGSRPTDAVKDVLVGLLEEQYAHDETVSYHPFPWRRPREGAQVTIPSVEQTADTLHTLTREEGVQGSWASSGPGGSARARSSPCLRRTRPLHCQTRTECGRRLPRTSSG